MLRTCQIVTRLALVAIMLIVGSACEATPTLPADTPTATRRPTYTVIPPSTSVPATSTPVPLKKSGTVVIGSTPMTAKHIVPIWLTSTPQFLMMPLVLPALTWFDDKAQPIPDLATKVDVNADATVYTFTLPKNAVWSDGTPLTAKDVAMTYKLALDPAVNSSLWGINLASLKGATEYQKGTAKDVEGLKIVNDQTIRFELRESNAAFLFNTYLGILPSSILGKVDPKSLEKNPYVDLPTVTSGPYDLVKYEPGKSIQLKKKPNYWGKRVNIDDLTIRLFDTPSAILGELVSGNVHIAVVPLDQAQQIRAMSHLDILSARGIAANVLLIDARTGDQLAVLNKPREQGGAGYNVTKVPKPYLQDKRFRRALSYAVDKNLLIQAAVNGEANAIYSPILAPDWAVNPGLDKYELNIDKAKGLMRDAGVTFDAEGNAQWNGSPITLVYLAAEGQDARNLGEELRRQLVKIGVRVDVKQVPGDTFLRSAIEGEGDLIRNVGGRFGADPSVSGLFFTCKAGWAELVMGYCNPKLDDLESKGLMASKPDDRKRQYWDASAILNDEAPSIFLFIPNTLTGVNKGLVGIKASADSNYLTWNIQDWSVQ